MNSNERRAVALFSGGIDSWAMLAFLEKRGYQVDPLHIDFGQVSANAERAACRKLLEGTDYELSTIDARSAETFDDGEIVGRNAFLCLAALTLGPAKIDLLAIGIHAGTSYFDCSQPFFERMDQLIVELTNGSTRLLAPFLHWEKPAVVDYAVKAGLSLRETYSCERGAIPPCGECLSCKDRARFL